MSNNSNEEPKEKFSDWLKKKPILYMIYESAIIYSFLSALVLIKAVLLKLIGFDTLAQSFFEVGFPVAFVISIYHVLKK